MSSQPPKSWAQYEILASDSQLFTMLRIRLVELAFTQHTQVAINAITLLREWGQGESVSGLENVPAEALRRAREKAQELILKEAESGGENGSENENPSHYANQKL